MYIVEGRVRLDVVFRERAPVLELLAREDDALPVERGAILVSDLALYHEDGVARLHVQHPGLTHLGLDEDLHLAFCRSEVCRRPRVSRDALCLSLCRRPRCTCNTICIGLHISGDLLCPPGTLCVCVCRCCCVLYSSVLYIYVLSL
jgi:hypothetical protein